MCCFPSEKTLVLDVKIQPWNPSSLKFQPWVLYPAKPVAQITSHAGQVLKTPSRVLSTTKGRHILWVNLLYEPEYGVGDVVHYSSAVTSTKKENSWSKEIQMMLKKLRQFVKEDMRKPLSERIDSVVWYLDPPPAGMWQVLDGLSPKHLELWELQDCDIDSLNTLQHQWNQLESLTLRNVSNCDLMTHVPKIFSQISSLTLDRCNGPDYCLTAVTHLKQLRILENDACNVFCYGVDNVQNLTKVLEVLEIETTNGCDFAFVYVPREFRDRLRKCRHLREFRLAASYPDSLDTNLASYIPSSVEKLSLRFTRSLPFLHNINGWIKHASDGTWLPHLKSFQLTVDPKSRVGGLEGDVKSVHWTRDLENPPRNFSAKAFDMEFENRRRVLYDVLKLNRPSIELLT